jgi:opacity protein-like surface antigen
MLSNRAPVLKSLLAISLLLLAAGFAAAQGRGHDRAPVTAPAQEYHRFSLSMAGGFGFAEGHHGLLDLRAEFQVGLTRRLRLGLGVGYLNDHGRNGLDGGGYDRRGMSGMSPWIGGSGPGMEDGGLRARIVPVSLNLYYGLPLGRKWAVFMSGGGSWYRGSFEGPAGDQNKNAWGAQAGLGLEYRLAPSLQLVAEAGYRFVEFHGLLTQVETPFRMIENLVDSMMPRDAGPVADYLKGALVALAPKPVRPVDMNLGGLSVRMGVKFGL